MDSLKRSLKKAAIDLGASALGVGLLAGLAFLADPVALAGVVKDPSKELLLLIPVVNFAAKLASDQVKHRIIPYLKGLSA